MLLFIRRRAMVSQDLVADAELKSPTLDEIAQATSQLTPAGTLHRETTSAPPGINAFDNWAEADVNT